MSTSQVSNPYEPPQEEPARSENSAWRHINDPLIDRWVRTTLFAIAVMGAIVTGLSTACVSR